VGEKRGFAYHAQIESQTRTRSKATIEKAKQIFVRINTETQNTPTCNKHNVERAKLSKYHWFGSLPTLHSPSPLTTPSNWNTLGIHKKVHSNTQQASGETYLTAARFTASASSTRPQVCNTCRGRAIDQGSGGLCADAMSYKYSRAFTTQSTEIRATRKTSNERVWEEIVQLQRKPFLHNATTTAQTRPSSCRTARFKENRQEDMTLNRRPWALGRNEGCTSHRTTWNYTEEESL